MRHSDLFGAVIEEALATETVVRFRAQGGSMYPTIRDGDTVTVAHVSVEEIVRGDVLLCRHGKRVVAHRVVGADVRDTVRVFHLRGDAKAAGDAPVGADAVVGRVIAVRRNGREVALCGRAARIRHRVRATASRAKWVGVSAATTPAKAVSCCRSAGRCVYHLLVSTMRNAAGMDVGRAGLR
jgi:signal peptidase I